MIELRRRYSGSKGSDSPSFSRLPAGYQEVEYIQNTGDSYIVLPFKFANIKFRFCVTPNDTISSMQMGYGSVSMIGFVKNSGVDAIVPIVNGKGTSIQIPTSKTIIHTIEIRHSDNKIIIDGIASPSTEIFSNTTGFGVFVRPEFTAEKMRGKMYVIQRDNGEGYIDQYIPCYRISDHKPGMYDIVNDVFYTNDGIGEFLYGPDVHYNIPPEYQQVEYLESTGTQYIVTSIKPKYGDSYDLLASISCIGGGHSYSTIISPLRFGCGDAGTNTYSGQFVVQANGRYNIAPYTMYDSKKKKIVYKWGEKYSASIYIDNELVYAWEEDNRILEKEIDAYLPIFCYYDSGKYSEFATMQMYEFNYYREDKIIAKLIPCYRKSDNEAGMYDLVSGEFYTNAGTGTFEVGPLVI